VAIVLGKLSLSRLVGVHPKLVAVVEHAAQLATPAQDFMVLEGVRSDTQCFINFGKGRTPAQCEAGGCPGRFSQPAAGKVTWVGHALSSNHRAKPDGFGHAVDLVPYPVDWNDAKRFDELKALMFRAAADQGVKLRWGGDWNGNGKPHEKGETDLPHFELAA
jgi:peptidoglycan L-alanyl-D-glutamate endopeptidase CwlK